VSVQNLRLLFLGKQVVGELNDFPGFRKLEVRFRNYNLKKLKNIGIYLGSDK
jgi:hypothetical protein